VQRIQYTIPHINLHALVGIQRHVAIIYETKKSLKELEFHLLSQEITHSVGKLLRNQTGSISNNLAENLIKPSLD